MERASMYIWRDGIATIEINTMKEITNVLEFFPSWNCIKRFFSNGYESMGTRCNVEVFVWRPNRPKNKWFWGGAETKAFEMSNHKYHFTKWIYMIYSESICCCYSICVHECEIHVYCCLNQQALSNGFNSNWPLFYCLLHYVIFYISWLCAHQISVIWLCYTLESLRQKHVDVLFFPLIWFWLRIERKKSLNGRKRSQKWVKIFRFWSMQSFLRKTSAYILKPKSHVHELLVKPEQNPICWH